MSDWQLGIDFGTSFTVAAIAQHGSTTVVDVESNGRSRMPSSVFVGPDGEILVGSAAQHQAVFAPERYEPTPKRALGEGELFLGDRLVPVTDLVAAVLRRVYTEASRQQGETVPSTVFVTHPADWAEARLEVLREAIEQADLPSYSLLAEPVAAAARIGITRTAPGQHVAVYDFGGGTFDAAVLLRTPDGFDIAGPPAGRDPLGGEDIDQRIIKYLGEVLSGDEPELWSKLINPPDVAWRRNAAGLHTEVQRAKETLSEVMVCQLWVPGLEQDIQLTRSELEQLIASEIDATVDALEQVFVDAGVGVADLAGIYLVGGSSRIPLVADTIWRRLGVQPAVQDNPKSVVALGAAGWATLAEAARSVPIPDGPPPVPTSGSGTTGFQPIQAETTGNGPLEGDPGTFRAVLAAAVGIDAWQAGCNCVAELTIDYQGSPHATLRARDEPAVGTVEQLAAQVGATRAARTPGYKEEWLGSSPVMSAQGIERRFVMTSAQGQVPMFEQYLVQGNRSYVIAGPQWAHDVAGKLAVRPLSLDADTWFESRFTLVETEGWLVSERLRVRRNGIDHGIVMERSILATGLSPEYWVQQQFDALISQQTGSKLVGRTNAPVLNNFAGEIVTTQWSNGTINMLSKRGVAVVGGEGFTMTISLPFDEQGHFAALARHARLHPEAVPSPT